MIFCVSAGEEEGERERREPFDSLTLAQGLLFDSLARSKSKSTLRLAPLERDSRQGLQKLRNNKLTAPESAVSSESLVVVVLEAWTATAATAATTATRTTATAWSTAAVTTRLSFVYLE